MAIDESARHRLHQKLEEVLGAQKAGILMEHLPPRGFGDLATKGDLELLRTAVKADINALQAELGGLRESITAAIDGLRAEFTAEHDALRHELLGAIDRSARQMMVWVSGMVMAVGGLAFTAGHLL